MRIGQVQSCLLYTSEKGDNHGNNRNDGSAFCAFAICCIVVSITILRRLVAVSYTHLDVYKRQVKNNYRIIKNFFTVLDRFVIVMQRFSKTASSEHYACLKKANSVHRSFPSAFI